VNQYLVSIVVIDGWALHLGTHFKDREHTVEEDLDFIIEFRVSRLGLEQEGHKTV
jgi:hypothetical protein